jgi:hypothetical protein
VKLNEYLSGRDAISIGMKVAKSERLRETILIRESPICIVRNRMFVGEKDGEKTRRGNGCFVTILLFKGASLAPYPVISELKSQSLSPFDFRITANYISREKDIGLRYAHDLRL